MSKLWNLLYSLALQRLLTRLLIILQLLISCNYPMNSDPTCSQVFWNASVFIQLLIQLWFKILLMILVPGVLEYVYFFNIVWTWCWDYYQIVLCGIVRSDDDVSCSGLWGITPHLVWHNYHCSVRPVRLAALTLLHHTEKIWYDSGQAFSLFQVNRGMN